MVDEVIAGYAAGETADGYPEEWDLDKLWRAFRQLFPITITTDDVIEEAGGDRAGLTTEFISEAVIADAQGAYERREEEFGSEVMREVERRVVLSVLDPGSGASTCTRWTTCVRASACAGWPA